MGPTAYVNDFAFPVGVTTTSLDIDLESYVTFTVAGNVRYESVQYDARSYGSGPFTTAIRSDVDSFGANLDGAKYLTNEPATWVQGDIAPSPRGRGTRATRTCV